LTKLLGMTTLYVRNFSCIDEAELHLSKLTVLIGPQASGKSVLSKLVYFLYDILSRQFLAIEDQRSFSAFKIELAEDFAKWFPPSAWGKRKFTIRFEAGPYSVDLARLPRRPHRQDEVRITFSSFFEQQYNSLLKSISARRRHLPERSLQLSRDFELRWRIQSAAERILKKELGPDFVASQMFVPAGRSFFTSIGKAIAVFEQGGILDPVTVQFGRFFASMRERNSERFKSHYWLFDRRGSLVQTFFGGVVRLERNQEYIEAQDGRKIPVAMLSSGQQELLPLVFALASFRRQDRDIIYIEEPEAHLFPTTQGQLVEYLANSISWPTNKKMVITTHSPSDPCYCTILAQTQTLCRKDRGTNSL
jgi:AAA domain, putative AbiEii toxin, Type IV TA system